MDYSNIADKVSDFIISTGNDALKNWDSLNVDIHSDGIDVTTNFDKKIEKEFSGFVLQNFPEHGFQGEEFEELAREAEFQWLIDPIDGTKFFAQKIPLWAISIALVQNGEPIIGLIYNPVSKQLYRGIKGQGADLNKEHIQLSHETDLKKLQINLDLSIGSESYIKVKTRIDSLMENLFANTYRVRMLGTGTMSLAWLAQGLFGAFIDPIRTSKKFVDIAAGLIIAKEAGASIYKIHREEYTSTIVARQEVINQLLEKVPELN